MYQLTFKLFWHLEIENELFLSGLQGKIRKTQSWHHYSLAFCIYMFKGCVSMMYQKTSCWCLFLQSTVHPVYSIVYTPVYSWMYIQCIVYTPVYGVQSSVHSLSSIVYIPVYSLVYKCTSMYSPMYGPLYSVPSSVQLEHSWHTAKCTSGHIWCTIQRHISVYTVQCKVSVCLVYIPMEQSDAQPSIHQCMSSVHPCTVQSVPVSSIFIKSYE